MIKVQIDNSVLVFWLWVMFLLFIFVISSQTAEITKAVTSLKAEVINISKQLEEKENETH